MRDADGGPADTATPELVRELVAQRLKLDQTIREMTTSRAVLDDVIAAASEETSGERGQLKSTSTGA